MKMSIEVELINPQRYNQSEYGINETMLARYVIKVTAYPSFMRLRVIRQIYKVH